MTQKVQKYIDKSNIFLENALYFLLCLSVLLGVVGFLPKILNNFNIWSNNFSADYFAMTKPIWGALLAAFVIIMCLLIVFAPLTTGEKDIRNAEDVDSPLIGLTKQQERAIINLLKEKGAPKDDSKKMNRSEVIYILNALIELGYIPSDTDIETLRLWTIKVTQYSEDDKDHFKGDFYRGKGNRKAGQTKDLIQEKLKNLPETHPKFLRFLRFS